MGRTSTQQKVGKKLKELRNDKGWSQEKLSLITKVDRSYISEIERGVRNPSIKTLDKLASALGVKTNSLL